MIRAARPEDIPALAALCHEVQALHLAAMPARYADPAVDAIAASLREQAAAPDIAIHVADAGADVVGYVVVRRVESAGNTFAHPRLTAHVEQLGVASRARRGGHGRALMAAAEAQARAWGAVAITLEVQAFNAGAVAFYRALGYDVTILRLARPLDRQL